MNVNNFKLENGINVTHIKTDKFKTNSISLLIHNQLDENTATTNALIPMVLKRGSKEYPTMQDLSIKLEELYGSSFNFQVEKKGERQIIHFYIDFINDKYLKDENNLFDECAKILNSIVTNPALVNGVFNEEYVEQEKSNLVDKIESKINDKVQYAVDRMYQLMCENEPFGVPELGRIDDIEKITPKALTDRYMEMMSNAVMTLIVVGDISEDDVKKLGKMLNIKSSQTTEIKPGIIKKDVLQLNEKTEQMDVNQSKLSFGLRTNRNFKDKDYPALLMYVSILGGGTHSKLFQNVREKASLAYYAGSKIEKFKGIIAITSGIETQNYEKARKIIIEQIEEMKKGNILDNEIQDALKTLKNSIYSTMDEPYQLISYYIENQIMENLNQYDNTISQLEKVTKQDIQRVANDVVIDTVYLIKPNEEV